MSISIKRWSAIDRAFEPVYKTFHFVMRHLMPVDRTEREEVVVIKFFGMGSIIRFLAMCEERQVDITRLTIITSHAHRELCELWGLRAVFIHTASISTLVRGCLKAVLVAGRIRPSIIIDFERCSSLVGIFRTILAIRARCATVSFEQRSHVSSKAVIHHVDHLSQEQIFLEGIRHFPIASTARNIASIPIEVGKIIVNINASDLLQSRRYDLGLFASAIRSVHEQHPHAQFYLTGVQSERDYVQKLVDDLSELPVHNVAGKWSLNRLMTELADCALLITGDSAPLHLGRYMQVSTLSIWGPTQPLHFGYSPSGSFEIFSLGMPCAPCFLHPHSKPAIACNGAITCMRQLDPKSLASLTAKLLSRTEGTREVVMPVNFPIRSAQLIDAIE